MKRKEKQKYTLSVLFQSVDYHIATSIFTVMVTKLHAFIRYNVFWIRKENTDNILQFIEMIVCIRKVLNICCTFTTRRLYFPCCKNAPDMQTAILHAMET